jgi:hypothetical protein
MYVNTKMTPVETIPRIEEGGYGSGGREEFRYDIFDTL